MPVLSILCCEHTALCKSSGEENKTKTVKLSCLPIKNKHLHFSTGISKIHFQYSQITLHITQGSEQTTYRFEKGISEVSVILFLLRSRETLLPKLLVFPSTLMRSCRYFSCQHTHGVTRRPIREGNPNPTREGHPSPCTPLGFVNTRSLLDATSASLCNL